MKTAGWVVSGFLLVLAPLQGQEHSTFYAAFADGQIAAAKGDWKRALADFRRAAELRPQSSSRVIIYGNNLLQDYYPHSQMLRCQLELNDLEGATTALKAAQMHREPESLWRPLADRLHRMEQARTQAQAHVQASKPEVPASIPPEIHPSTEPLNPSHSGQPLPPPQALASVPTEVPALPITAPRSVAAPKANPIQEIKTEASNVVVPGPRTAIIPEQPSVGSRRGLWLVPLGAVLVLLGWLLARRRKRIDGRESHGADTFRDPEVIGPYRILRPLGRGGFAATFLAEHRSTGEKVALKVLLVHRSEDASYLERFRQEAQLGARLDHPGIVKILDPGPAEGQPWIAMSYEPGPTLEQQLKTSPMSLFDVLDTAIVLASAMSHAHLRGVIHRDLKPGNIVMTPAGPKVMDFGIARVMDSLTLTTTYAFLGTPLYAAPEVQITSTVGPEADCYSLGVILFEMLAGHPPFHGETPFEILDLHRREPAPDLGALRPDLPMELVQLISELLAKEPAARPSDEQILKILSSLHTPA